MRFIVTTILIAITSGCNSTSRDDANAPMRVSTVSFVGEELSKSEIDELRNDANNGDGEAAYRLFAYYGIGAGKNDQLSQKYLRIAENLEYPPALFNRALEMWATEREPDMHEVLRLLKRAIELGYSAEERRRMGLPDEQDLLHEIEDAIEAGFAPRRSKFRLF